MVTAATAAAEIRAKPISTNVATTATMPMSNTRNVTPNVPQPRDVNSLCRMRAGRCPNPLTRDGRARRINLGFSLR
jgi:hypothetical protein